MVAPHGAGERALRGRRVTVAATMTERAGELVLGPWDERHAEAAAALSTRYFAPDPSWTADLARAQLRADAFAGGRQVVTATRGGRLVGLGAWIAAPPWLYLWPVMAEDEAVAGALLDRLCAADGQPGLARVRVSVRAAEPAKGAAVAARGFAPAIDFVELVRSPAGAAVTGPPTPPGLTVCTGPAIDRAAMHATHDHVFLGVANSGPMTPGDFAELLDGPRAWPTATAGWFAADGTCAGFVIGLRHPDHGVVEAIGVADGWRRRGLAQAILGRFLAVAAAEQVPEVRAIVASDNPGSLALHRAAGFVERARKVVWERTLPVPTSA